MVNHPALQRWRAKGKAEMVLEGIKGRKPIVNAAKEYSFEQS
jgi:hypothetical protein